MNGRQKAAVLLVSLGAEASAEVFKHLRQDEIDELTLEIAGIGHVPQERKQAVVEEFYETALAQDYIAEGGLEYARAILEKALGSDRANDVMTRLSGAIQVSPFEFLRRTDAGQILNVIANEHPQTVALVMAYLPARDGRPGRELPARRPAGRGRDADRPDGPHRARGDPRDRAGAASASSRASSTRTSRPPAACARWWTC